MNTAMATKGTSGQGTPPPHQREKKASAPKNVFDEAVNIINLSTCFFHLCCMLRYDGYLEEKHLYDFEL